MELINADTIKKNCEDYFYSDSKAPDVLRKANGKRNYHEIAKIVGLHPTRTSSLLKKSLKQGLSIKNNLGYYHKKPGILGYMPKSKKKNYFKETSTENKLEGISKKALKASNISNPILSRYQAQHIDKMAEAYVWLYTAENTLRELIRKVLGPTNTWWNTLSNQSIKTKISEAIRDYPYDGAVRKDELEYTHIGQLKEIISSKNNWKKFEPFLNVKSKSKFEFKIDDSIPSRNSIGHCIPLKPEDRTEVVVRFRDILKMIKK